MELIDILIDRLLSSLVPLLGIWLLGAVVFMAIVRKPGRFFRLERLLYCYPLGMSALGMPLFLLSWAGVGMITASQVMLGVIVAAAVAVAVVRRKTLVELWFTPAPSAEPRARISEFEWFLILVIILCLGARTVDSLLGPLGDWDGIAGWGVKGKVLFYNTVRRTDYFYNGEFSQTNLPYPLLWPFMFAWMCSWSGQWDDLGIMVLTPINLIVFAGLLYFTLRKFTARTVALGVTAIMVSLPPVQYHSAAGQADLPMVLIGGSALFCLFDWIRNPRRDVILLAAVLMGGALFTKQEGKLQFIANMAGATLSVALATPSGERRRAFQQLALFAGVALAWALPWLIFQRGITDLGHDLSSIGLGAVRWSQFPALMRIWIASAFHWRNQLQLAKWHILWPLLILILLVSKAAWRPPFVWPLVIFAFYFAGLCVIALSTRWPLELDVVEIGFERYMIIMLVPLWLVLGKCLDDLWNVWTAPGSQRTLRAGQPT